jgi:hypothetical protein
MKEPTGPHGFEATCNELFSEPYESAACPSLDR